jgi:hypothetical protein
VLSETSRRVKTVGEWLGRVYEIALVNDGSSDDTFIQMWELAERDSAERVLIVDADLLDPPELLPQMHAVSGPTFLRGRPNDIGSSAAW